MSVSADYTTYEPNSTRNIRIQHIGLNHMMIYGDTEYELGGFDEMKNKTERIKFW